MDYLEEMEWISTCCEAPPLYDLHIEDNIQPIGLCMKCRDNSGFYIEGGEWDESKEGK